jgi:hypothetical protein
METGRWKLENPNPRGNIGNPKPTIFPFSIFYFPVSKLDP